jgi:hypothetical protein
MRYVENRSFLLIIPRKPFVDWVNRHNEEEYEVLEEDIYSQKTLYMVEPLDYDSFSEINELVKKKHRDIFINELWAWYEDEEYIPKNITYELFNEWFEFEFVEMCFDTLKSKIDIED